MPVCPIAISLVVFPLPFVDIAVCMPELAMAFRLVPLPLAFVSSSHWPSLDARTVSQSTLEVASIDLTLRYNQRFYVLEFFILSTLFELSKVRFFQEIECSVLSKIYVVGLSFWCWSCHIDRFKSSMRFFLLLMVSIFVATTIRTAH